MFIVTDYSNKDVVLKAGLDIQSQISKYLLIFAILCYWSLNCLHTWK